MTESKYRIFVINLDRSPQRLADMTQQLGAFDLPFMRIAAFDGNSLSDEEIAQAAPPDLVAKTYHRQLGRGEVGCGLSHRAAWQEIIAQDLDFAIVLEDDIELQGNFAKTVELISTLNPDSWDFIKFFPLSRYSENNIDRRFFYHGFTFVTYRKFPLGCQGQAISRRAAEKMIQNMPHVLEPIDSQLKAWWELDIFPFGVLPYCVRSELGGPSDINPGSRLEQMPQQRPRKVWNKLRRAAYRKLNGARLNRRFDEFTATLAAESER